VYGSRRVSAPKTSTWRWSAHPQERREYLDGQIYLMAGESLAHGTICTNLTIEVLSPTTEAFDRGEKFARYQEHLDSLTDYVVVARGTPLVEHFARQPSGEWGTAATATHLLETVELSSIGCTPRLSEVYESCGV
jgi:Uma2 family endonuclease